MMKLRLFSVICAASLIALASCRNDKLTGPNPPVSSDTVAYWTFDGNAHDVSGNRHDGLLSGNYNFDGPNRFGETSKSIAVIGGGEMAVVSMPNFSDNDSYSVSFWVNVSPSGNFVSPDYGFGADSAYFGAQPMGCGLITSSHAVGEDHWRLITLAVAAHNSATLYIDTVEEATKPYGSYAGTNDSMAMYIEFNQGGTMSDTVRLDDALVLHSCLSASEVATRFHEGGWYENYSPATLGTGWSKGNFGTTASMKGICFPTPQIGYACGANGTVLKSVDSGMTWTPQNIATSQDLYGISFLNPLIGIVGGNNGAAFYTRDGGATWIASSTTGFQTQIGAVENIRDMKLIGPDTNIGTYAIMVGGTDVPQPRQNQGFEMVSGDSGRTWTGGSPEQAWLYSISRMSGQDFFSSAEDSGLATVVGAHGQVLWSAYGEEWEAEPNSGGLNNGSDLLGVDFAWDHGFAVGTSGTIYSAIYHDTTVGATWTPDNSGVSSSLRAAYTVNDSEAWVAGDNGVILHTLNDGQTWARADIPGVSIQWNKIVSSDANHIALIGATPNVNHIAFVGANGTLYWRTE